MRRWLLKTPEGLVLLIAVPLVWIWLKTYPIGFPKSFPKVPIFTIPQVRVPPAPRSEPVTQQPLVTEKQDLAPCGHRKQDTWSDSRGEWGRCVSGHQFGVNKNGMWFVTREESRPVIPGVAFRDTSSIEAKLKCVTCGGKIVSFNAVILDAVCENGHRMVLQGGTVLNGRWAAAP